MGANFQKIIDKISEAFSFFDFSFLISGAATMGICCYGLNRIGMKIESNNMALNVIVAIFAIYIAGLLSFAIGKQLRKVIANPKGKAFKNLFIKTHKYVSPNIEVNDNVDELNMKYSKMWAYLRDTPKAKDSLAFLNRFWVMQAVFEGLLTSSILSFIWGFVILHICDCKGYVLYDAWCMIILGIISAVTCHIESTRYAKSQIKDVIITYYGLQGK